MSIRKYGRYWAVIDAEGTLVCLCVYRKGAEEVVRRLQARCQRTSFVYFVTSSGMCTQAGGLPSPMSPSGTRAMAPERVSP
jgi:hypothetical protein